MNPNVKVYTLIALVLSLLFCGSAWADETDLVWSTFLGGGDPDQGRGIVVDNSGNVYVTGYTESVDFPTTSGAFDETSNGLRDVFVVKINEMGSTLEYSTIVGGSSDDRGYDIAVDDSGNAYVTGYIRSTDFPTTSGAFDTTYNGGWVDAFVAMFNATGSALKYSTFLGGNDEDYARGIALDSYGSTYVTGLTYSTNFPTTSEAFDTTFNGASDVFVTKLSPAGNTLPYSTILGGSLWDSGLDISLDANNNAYLIGYTASVDFPTTAGVFDNTYNGGDEIGDSFVARLNAAGSVLEYATFLGGSEDDGGGGIALDDSGNAHVTGYTGSVDFPVTAGAFDITYNGSGDIFVAKLVPAMNTLNYATFLGGSDEDGGGRIALDNHGSSYVIGETNSANFPITAGALDTTHSGSRDVCLVKLNTTGSDLEYSTFLGGSTHESGGDIAVDNAYFAFVIGGITAGVFDTTYNGNYDAFVAKLDLSSYPVPVVLASFQATGGQSCIRLDWVTASEINCHRWEIYRSKQEDGAFTEIGVLSGQGSTEMNHIYRWVDHNVSPGVTYFYKLKQVDFDGSATWLHTVSASATMPLDYTLHQNYPNPFNPCTEITYTIPQDSHVTLKVYNILSAEVAALVDAHQEANFYTVRWDAKNLASGVYFCRLQAGDFEKIIKMVLLK